MLIFQSFFTLSKFYNLYRLAGDQTCWCVREDGGLITESIDPSRELTQEQCLLYRGAVFGGDNDIEGI